MIKELEVSSSQIRFLESSTPFTLYCGGIGSGKTFGGGLWAAMMTMQYPDCSGMITANTHSQLQKATLSGFFKVLDLIGIGYEYKQQSGEVHIGKTIIYALAMENYEAIRGIEVGWVWGDECAFYKERAFDVCIGRIRDKRGPCQWKGTTTPNGFNWIYKRAVQFATDDWQVIYARTKDNAGNLGDNYLKTLHTQYDDKLAKQELEGQFINLSEGKVYYYFDREKHVKPAPPVFGTVVVGLDFNVDPMCGMYCIQKDGIIYITKELYLRDSNTFNAAEKIKADYPGNRKEVVADSTGDKRRSSARNTDHEILRRYGLDVVPFKNPYVKDRYNNVNRLFFHEKLFIDPSCKNLIADLEQLVYENKDDLLGHITDALGYACWYLQPLKKPKRAGYIHLR